MKEPLTWLEISRGALRANARAFRQLVGRKTHVMAVVKSNAYGHGVEQVVDSLKGYVDWFGVANLTEALELRTHDRFTPILVLSYWTPDQWQLAAQHAIELGLYSLDQVRSLSRLMRNSRKTIRCQLKLDVGTSRVGLSESDLGQACTILKRNPRIRITGAYSHFADAENTDQHFTNLQLRTFTSRVAFLESQLGPIPHTHIACTAAALMNERSRLGMVRIGIGIYGIWPDQSVQRWMQRQALRFTLTPALSWKTRLIQVKSLTAGTTIGYGRSHRLKRQTVVGILPIGYNEGFDRRFSNLGQVIVNKKRVPVLGRVCMNLTMVGVGEGARPGDEVTLLGGDAKKRSAEEAAAEIGTIAYELVTRIPASLPRRLVP